MPKSLVYFSQLLLIIAVLVSCNHGEIKSISPSATEQRDAQLDRESLRLVEEVESLPKSVVSLGYAKLNSQQKVLLWNRHIDKCLQDPNMSVALKKHVLKLKGIPNVDMYDKDQSEQQKAIVDKLTESWYTKPVEAGLFTADELLNVCTVARLGVADNVNARAASPSDFEIPQLKPPCNCNYNIGCVRRCNTGACGTDSKSCGFFGSSTCSGACG